MNSVMFSHTKEEWETPQDLFDALNSEFHFTIDVAASPENAKCARYYTSETDGLSQDWTDEIVWCNPPYGRKIKDFVRKAAESDALTVMLLPARTDTKWFHDYIYKNPCVETRLLKGRLKFVGAKNTAPFPPMIAIFWHY